jgi:Putative Ig domain
MKKHAPIIRDGVAARARARQWSDPKRRLLRTWLIVLLLHLFASNGVHAQNSKLVGLASRLLCQNGDAVSVSEFVIQGGTKHVLVRAIGPSLSSLGVVGALQDPMMELRDSAGTLIRANNDWRDSQEAQIQASGLAPTDNRESAIDATLTPGMYTTVIRGFGNTSGVAVSEVYDLDGSASSLTALGTRGLVQTGDNVLISTAILSGSQNQDVLVRALGPSLTNSGLPGALADPTLELRDGNGALVAANDNWRASQETAIQNSGLAPAHDLESAIIVTLPPQSYSAILRGTNNGTGLGFVQYYVLPYSGNALNPTPPLPSPTPPPVITSPPGVSDTVGQLFVYQFEASGATSLAVSNLPAGLFFNTMLHAITGNPGAPGTFQIGLSATNSAGTANATLTLTVQPSPSSGPTIVSSTAATGRTGQPFTFQVITVDGSPSERLTVSGLPSGLTADPVSGLISGTPTSDGSFAVTLTVTDGAVVAQSSLQLTFTSDPARPVIISPGSVLLTPGQSVSYTISAPASADPSDPTIFNFLGTLPPGLSFNGTTGTISGTYTGLAQDNARDRPHAPNLAGGALLGAVQLFGTNSHGTSTFQLLFLASPSGAVNISTRLRVGTGENVLIAGFIITGNAPKVVIIRAIGLSAGIKDALQDPTLELHDSANNKVVNDNWKTTQEQIIRDTGVPPGDDHESAIVIALDPGNYTAVVAAKEGTPPGIALAEVYDLGTASLDTSGNSKLANISTRGLVQTGNNVMIGGFIIQRAPTQVVVRAIGPSLTDFGISGALPDPFLELRGSNGDKIVFNDDWKMREDGSSQQGEIEATKIQPMKDSESAVVRTLPPGNYTAIVRSKDNLPGVALVEVYVLP